jgi:tRNA-2-methylthio-N6-dimethylallyladenosine synthase
VKYYKILTYGCQMNEHESEKLAGFLTTEGYGPTSDNANADVIVLNTCCVRAGAEDRVYGNLGALLPLKRQKPSLVIAVCGCMSQNQEAFETLKNRFTYVDIVFGTHNFDKFREFLSQHERTGERVLEFASEGGPLTEYGVYRRESGDRAYVNIMYGCDNFCSYCIVPYVRGRERSRAPDAVLREIAELAAQGYKEITLLGQNVNSYRGADGDGAAVGFPELLRKIDALPDDFKLAFMTSHPKDLSRETVEAVADCAKLKKEIHLPVQSGSDTVLNAMNRKYTVAQYLTLLDGIRERIPSCAVSSDVIVGFPGETEDDFQSTMELVRRARFTNLFMFMFSPRPGTPAAKMPDQIPAAVKKRRVNELIGLQRGLIKAIKAEGGAYAD